MTEQALQQIASLYAIEAQIRGRPPNERRAQRQTHSASRLSALHDWMTQTQATLSYKSETTAAIQYALNRWEALVRFVDDGRIEIDNNAAERSLNCAALGRRNYLFMGSDAGGHRAAAMYSLIGTAKLNDLNPEAYLRHVLSVIDDSRMSQIADLLPWNITQTLSPTTPIAA